MSRLQDLINELCPDGVEYTTFGEVVNYEQPSNYIVKSTDYNDSFSTPVLTAGQTFILGYTNEQDGIYNASKELPVIIFDDFTGAFKWVDFPFKVKSSAMKILTADETKVTLRYVYHFMGNIGFTSDEHKRLWIGRYSAFKLPLPPLPVQREIVRILDNFTELTAELTARKKQYEYYRDSLLSFEQSDMGRFIGSQLGNLIQKFCLDGVGYVSLGEVARYPKLRIDASEIDENTYVGVENLLQNKQGKTIANSIPTSGTVIAFNCGDILIGNIRPYLKKIWLADCNGGTNGDVLVIQINDSQKLNSKFLYYVLSSDQFFLYDVQNSKGAKMPRGSKDAVMKYPVPLPPLSVQREIVRILDRFDTLCNDLTGGLPAEIAARQKQYEYYRDKLLQFRIKNV